MSKTEHKDPVQSVLDRLEGVRQTGPRQWEARCPAHDDRHASLSIGRGDDGRALIDCKAGCPMAEVVKALDMEIPDLFATPPASSGKKPQTKGNVRGRIVATYDYRDSVGALLFQVVRFAPKGFRQRRPNGNGGWAWKLGDVPRVPYRLPELLAADKNAWAFVSEGEKDADNLAALGLVATTNPGGAGKWGKLADDSALYGRRVAVIADRDAAGLAHAQNVAGRLHGKAAVVKVIDLPDMPPQEDGRPRKDVSDWIEWLGGKTAEELAAALVSMAEDALAWIPTTIDKAHADAGADKKPAQAEAIVRLALERYRLGVTATGEPFAVERGGPNVARIFRGGRDALRAALARDYRRAHHRTANAAALADALTTLEGECLDTTPEPVCLRVADSGNSVVLDLGDTTGQAVVVRPGEWEIVSPSPVLFRRTALTGILPLPQRGASLADLRSLLNLTDETWPLVRGWLLAAMLPSIPHPILLLGGEQGTGKSTAARMLVNLIDPSPAPLRSEPRDAEGWALAAAGSWAVAIDNVSRIPGWWSNVLCRAVSGDGWVRRRLYTDSDLSVLAFRRVVILTSIDAGAMRGDLGDRLLLADLGRIGDADRKTEAELDRQYASIRPRLLGGLLDLLAQVLLRLPGIRVPTLPRMADFARVLAAVDEADGADGQALSLYMAQGGRIAGEVLEADAVAVAVLALLDRTAGRWEGTTTELLQAIRPADKSPRGWPETARGLAGQLKRLTPALRAAGVEVDRDRTGHNRNRVLTLRRTGESTVRTVREDAECPNPSLPGGRPADNEDACGPLAELNRPPEGAEPSARPPRADGADGSVQPNSGQGPGRLDPERPGPKDLLDREQRGRYDAIYYSRPAGMSPAEKHGRAWRAALRGGTA